VVDFDKKCVDKREREIDTEKERELRERVRRRVCVQRQSL
jgi:hypothetical protein